MRLDRLVPVGPRGPIRTFEQRGMSPRCDCGRAGLRDDLPGHQQRNARPQTRGLLAVQTTTPQPPQPSQTGPMRPAWCQRAPGIAERPDFAGYALVGQWEVDLIIGARNKSAAITLVEMSSGFQVVYGLGTGYNAEQVAEQLAVRVQAIPEPMCRSLTWDRGSEMAGWERLKDGWGLPV